MELTPTDDSQIVREVLAGHRELYASLVRKYSPMLRAMCASRVGDADAVDDLVQEAFVHGYEKLGTLRNPSRFGPWLAVIARNQCKLWWRSRKRRERAHAEAAAQTVDEIESPFSAAARNELSHWIHAQIRLLPMRTREAMHLCYVEGLSIEEAADTLRVKRNALKQRLSYGRRAISEELWQHIQPNRESPNFTDRTRRVMSAIPTTLPPVRSTGRLLPLGISFALLCTFLALLAGIYTRAGVATNVSSSTLRVRLVPSEGATIPQNWQVCIAPQDFNVNALRRFLSVEGVPESQWPAIEKDLFSAKLDVPAALSAALEDVAARDGVDSAISAWTAFLPDRPLSDWRFIRPNEQNVVEVPNVRDRAYAIEIVRTGSGDNAPPWRNRQRLRLRLNRTDTTTRNIEIPIAELPRRIGRMLRPGRIEPVACFQPETNLRVI